MNASALGQLHVHIIALGLAEHRAGDRSTDRDLAGLHVALVLTDEHVDDLLIGVHVEQRDRGAEPDRARVDLLGIDDLREPDASFEVSHSRRELRLALLRRVVLRVLAQVAVAERSFDVLDVLRALDLFEVPKLVAEHLEPGGGHGDALGHRSNLGSADRRSNGTPGPGSPQPARRDSM
jgi:hypothetical protein